MKILVDLEGEILDRFESYKKRENLKGNAPTVYKLIADRLDDVEKRLETESEFNKEVAVSGNA